MSFTWRTLTPLLRPINETYECKTGFRNLAFLSSQVRWPRASLDVSSHCAFLHSSSSFRFSCVGPLFVAFFGQSYSSQPPCLHSDLKTTVTSLRSGVYGSNSLHRSRSDLFASTFINIVRTVVFVLFNGFANNFIYISKVYAARLILLSFREADSCFSLAS